MRRSTLRAVALLCLVVALASCTSGGKKPMQSVERGWKQSGVASWYGAYFHGRRTANGEIYDMYGMTAAHKRLPFDTLVEVSNLDNGKKTQVRINDRGPFVRGRIIDLTHTAADRIGMIGPGTAKVRIRVLGQADVGDRRYFIQVGAFSDAQTARDMERDLASRYPKVRVESEGGLHRVLVGRYRKRGQAQKVANQLARDGYDTVVRSTQ